MKSRIIIPIVFFLASLLSACGIGRQVSSGTAATQIPTFPQVTAGTPGDEITIAAAADLQFAFTEIAKNFEEETNHKVTLVFGSTGQLAQQIENGAPYDLIVAADRSYVDRLAGGNFVLADSVALYARGRIVLAVNRKAEVNATNLFDLSSPQIKHIAIANPAHAPYGVAAQQALQAAGLWDGVQDKLVYGENVRQALQYVQTGDSEVGIVALSVADVPEITWTLIDSDLHEPLDQALAVVTTSKNSDLARQFAAYINGATGRPIMVKYGFVLPGELVFNEEMQTTTTPTAQP